MIVSALGRALKYGLENPYNGNSTSMVQFCTGAVAQGVLLCVHGMFILKYLQSGFRTIYLILRSLLHLDVH